MSISWASRALSLVATLYLIPTLFRYMSQEELGIWYLLGNSQAFLGLLGFGVAPVLTRHLALLVKDAHMDAGGVLEPRELIQLGDLLHTGRTLLRWMAVFTFLVAWVIGFLLIRSVHLQHVGWTTVFWSWTLMCAGWGLSVWMSYLDCWTAGLGYVGWDTLIAMSIATGTIVANIIAVRLGGGLFSLSCIALISVLVQRALLVWFLRRRKTIVFSIAGRWSRSIATSLWAPSLRTWVTIAGGFLLYKTDQYFIAMFRGVSEVALYQSTYNTVFMAGAISQAYIASSCVFVSQYWANGDLNSIQILLVRGCRIGFIIAATGAVFLLSSGREFFQLWLNGAFLGYPILVVLVTTIMLDTQHILLTGVSRATEDEKYATPAIVSGLLNLLLTWVLIQRMGLIGVPIGTLCAQLVTNNWYGIYRPLLRLRFPFRLYLRAVVTPILLYAALTSLGTVACMRIASRMFGASNLVLCVSALIPCALFACTGLYLAFRTDIKLPAARIAVTSA